MLQIQLGESIRLPLLLEDGDATKYPKVYIYDENGANVGIFALVHIEHGLYLSDLWTPSATGIYHAVFIVYEDAAGTVVSSYSRTLETILVTYAEVVETCGLSCAYDEQLDKLYINVWLERGGQTVSNVSTATVEFFNIDGTSKFVVTSNSPDAQGIFRMTKDAPQLATDRVYQVRITIDNTTAHKGIATFN